MSKRTKFLLGIGVIAALVIGWQVVAYAASLTGSKFEIDQPDANMVVNGAAGSLDWANVADTKTEDLPTGGTDNSYKGGVKEDTVCPGQTTGTIPDQKADLRYFGVYQEAGPVAGDPGFLHLFWTRVSEPSGATLMDFEFNKNKTKCTTNGSPNVLRTAGDLLIEYKIEGGTDNDPDITIRRWVGNATSGQWGTATTLPPADAIGAINLSPISNPTGTADSSDGTLPDGTTSENRTFGEASIDLSALFDPTKCESFGAAMLKSRAGPPFDSQVKDFIAPNTGINIQNCAQVIIKKETLPEENPNTTNFSFTKNFTTDPTSLNTFTLQDDGVKDFGKTVLLGGPYTVTESAPTGGYQLKGVDCSASNLGSDPDPTTTTATVNFKLDSATDVLNCTYTNEKPEGALLIKKQSTKTGNPLVSTAGAVFTIGTGADAKTVKDNNNPAGNLTDADTTVGQVCVAGLAPGSYQVDETTPPSGYGDSATAAQTKTVVGGTNCTDNKPASDGATFTFTNPPLADIQVRFKDGGSGETKLTTDGITCTVPNGSGTTTEATNTDGWNNTENVTGVKIDPSPQSIQCTIPIDP